ncbi:hypothetical protein MOV08_21095 [Streptomyces yunnanensis]|uniref:Scaffolding protein n=1 Tax=Streptomyces yunnanensis TaxID=156453 RepID=A0ABY8ABB8_9ACTN|nr:hypothetical protein [Streptomyces yunnanensis]WEB41519.1 hypothetical protein MOV08_21095 [Streptomyces yunnanensis]
MPDSNDDQATAQPQDSIQRDQEDHGDVADPAGSYQLGDAGKRALDTMKARFKAEREARRTAEAALEAAQRSDEETARQRELEQAAVTKANARILRAEIRAAAKGQLTDPTDALTFMDLDRFEVGPDGAVDIDEITEAIGELLKAKPYLGTATSRTPRFEGTGDGGARAGQSPKPQLTREELAKLSPTERLAAFNEGRCKNLTG